MSTPPIDLPPQLPKRIRLAPIAVILVVILIVAFGVCAANLNLNGPTPPLASVAICVEIVCIIGLIVIAILAIARKNRPN